jgi:uncharacterized iron-regulated membrane protein
MPPGDTIPLVSRIDEPESRSSGSRPPVATEPPARQNTRLRSVLFWSHLITGVTVGLVVLIMSVTGAALAYERQLLDRAATKHRVLPTAAGAARLPLDTLYERATSVPSGMRVVSLTVFADSTKPVTLGLESRQSIFVDPYSGRVLGNDGSVRAFMTVMIQWHRWLGIGGAARSPVGTAITGASNLAFLFLIITGFILWFPRQWSTRAFSAVIRFNRRVGGRARDWNWHHVLGFWSAPALFLIVLSATFISYRWPGELLERYAGSGVAAEGAAGGSRPERRPARPAAATGGPPMTLASLGASLDSVARRTAALVDGWRTIQIRLPRDPGGALTVTAAMTVSALPNERVQLSVDKTTGALVPSVSTTNTGTAAKIRSWIRPIHTGEAGGILGQTLAAIVSLAAAVLFWTGIALTWRRYRSRATRRMRAAARKGVAA